MSSIVRPFDTVLVANRGEIALRIMRSLRRLGYGVLAVHSEADRDSPHVRAADRSVLIGAAPPRASYLNVDAIVEAARCAGADAVHPGYGFLAENAEFAEAVSAAGLVFIGPPAAAIRAMGNKAQAKRLLIEAGMPCIPGYQGSDQSDAAFVRAADDIGFPVMVKAAAGGGGRGMRLVASADQLPAALASARSEAGAAFGSDELILERAVIAPRHVEIQVLADAHGHVVHLGERDCSVQRRHQKLIEEAPSPAVDAELRARMGEAAVRSARAIGYVGAGTMEFLLDREGRFYFMEMNTRLQVEHAVTEAITGLDLVEWQLRIAAGEPLALRQDELRLHGHAIEVRLTAEDVPAGFLPQTGPVLRWRLPAAADVRIDHALLEGGEVSAHYDSMVAKLIAHGRTRDEARRKLLQAVRQCVLLGLPSNQGFLADCLSDRVFADGHAVHTGFIHERFGDQPGANAMPGSRCIAWAAFALLARAWPASAQEVLTSPVLGAGAGYLVLGRSNARWSVQVAAGAHGDWVVTVSRHLADRTSSGSGGAGSSAAAGDAAPADSAPQRFTLRDARWLDPERATLSAECDGISERTLIAVHDGQLHLFHDGRAWSFECIDARKASRQSSNGGGTLTAPLTGRVVDVAVQVGDSVQVGQRLLVLEAMKMEHTLTAPISGRVAELNVHTGGQAAKGALLLRIEEST
ncbi:MAG: ATP-grasp domain-containing protein [Burkholderiales bacterium]|nr:ATP-grasp domain-containing protein [Burkholderiales bacterium]